MYDNGANRSVWPDFTAGFITLVIYLWSITVWPIQPVTINRNGQFWAAALLVTAYYWHLLPPLSARSAGIDTFHFAGKKVLQA